MDEIGNAWWAALDLDEAGRAARALLCAAVDATCAGHRGPLPLPLLTAAMRGYATDPGFGASPDLVERGLARATLPGSSAPALAPRDDGFIVDAAVVAAVTATRPGALPAPALWDALVAHASDPNDRLRIAREAERRSLFRHAVELCLPPAMADHAAAWMILARRLDDDTMTGATAEACLRHAAGLGDPAALFALGLRLQSTRRPDEGTDFIRRAAEAGHPPAMGNWASTLERAGQRAEAADLRERVASLGKPEHIYLWGNALVKAGEVMRGEAWLARAADAGHHLAMRTLDELLRRQGREAEAASLRRFGLEPGGATGRFDVSASVLHRLAAR